MPPTEEQTYRKGLEETMIRIERKIDDNAANLEKKVDGVDEKVSYTNGKVRKIIICLVLLTGIVIGMNFSSPKEIISLFAGSASI